MRWLLTALVTVCAALWVDALAGGGLAGSVPAVVVVAALSLASGLRAPLLPLAVAGVASAMLLSVADQVVEPAKFSLASDGVFYSVVVLGPALVGWLIGSRNRQVADLQQRRRALEIRRGVAVRAARARERDRVERRVDLSLAEHLRRVVRDARTAAELAAAEPDRVPDLLAAVEQTARDALGELRDVLGVLHHVRSGEPGETETVAAAVSADPPPRRRRRLDLVDVALVAATVPLAVETALPGHGPAALNALMSLAQGGALVLVAARAARAVPRRSRGLAADRVRRHRRPRRRRRADHLGDAGGAPSVGRGGPGPGDGRAGVGGRTSREGRRNAGAGVARHR